MGEAKAKKMYALKNRTAKEENGGKEFFGSLSDLKELLKELHRVSKNSFSFESEVVEYIDLSDIILKKRHKALLYQMKLLTKKQNTVLSQFEQNLHSFFSILYGMCSSRLSFIFNAFTGASLARILS